LDAKSPLRGSVLRAILHQGVAATARAHLEGLADRYATPAREAELIVIFKEATRLEADFWEMGWRLNEEPSIR